MTEQEAAALAAKLTRICMPDGSFGEGATWQLQAGEFKYTARITDQIEMEFGRSPLYDGVGFHLRRTQDGRMTGNLYCALTGSSVQNAMPPGDEAHDNFARFFTPLMRSYCWLSGCPIESSDQEQESWTHWLHEREETGRGEATHTPAWEVRRIAAAFDVQSVETVQQIVAVHYEGLCGDVPVTWALGDPNARVKNIQVGERSYCGIFFANGRWEWEDGQEGHEEMARGLYRLGFENEFAGTELPELSWHEKLELRLRFPREFWPQNWLEEAEMQR